MDPDTIRRPIRRYAGWLPAGVVYFQRTDLLQGCERTLGIRPDRRARRGPTRRTGAYRSKPAGAMRVPSWASTAWQSAFRLAAASGCAGWRANPTAGWWHEPDARHLRGCDRDRSITDRAGGALRAPTAGGWLASPAERRRRPDGVEHLAASARRRLAGAAVCARRTGPATTGAVRPAGVRQPVRQRLDDWRGVRQLVRGECKQPVSAERERRLGCRCKSHPSWASISSCTTESDPGALKPRARASRDSNCGNLAGEAGFV